MIAGNHKHRPASTLEALRRSRKSLGILLIATFISLAMAAQVWAFIGPAFLVKDINNAAGATGNAFQFSSTLVNPRLTPKDMLTIGSVTYFSGRTGPTGRELWKSDGTAAGTVQVKDIFPGGNSSNPTNFASLGGVLFFTANNGANGTEVWKSDGTDAGTVLVADVRSGPSDSNPSSLVASGSNLYFIADNGTNGAELWKTNGVGASLVKDIRPGADGSAIAWMTDVNGTLYFAADNNTNGLQLWKSDGTSGGTVMVTAISPGGSSASPSWLTAVGSTVFFAANDQTNGNELWKSDGTAGGTVLVKDVYPGKSGSNPVWLTAVGSTLFFAADDGTNGNEVWKSDGTSGGTVLVKNIASGSGNSSASWLTNVGGTLFFNATDRVTGFELYKSDGTDAGTVQVKDIYPGANASNPAFLTALGSTLYFGADDGTNGFELWKSDGTSGGTTLIKQIRPPSGSAEIGQLTPNGSTLLFVANDGIKGRELYKTDGTAGNTVLVTDVNTGAPSSDPNNLVYFGNALSLFYSADDGVNGRELYQTDSNNASKLVKDIRVGAGGSDPAFLRSLSNLIPVVFVANDGHGRELYAYDGTNVTQLTNVPAGGADPQTLVVINGVVYFAANDGVNGRELWRSDGTVAGTTIVKDINPGAGDSTPTNLRNVFNTLFFSANDGTNGRELWKSDGTDAGTSMVKNINAAGSSNPLSLVAIGNVVFFSADDGVNGLQLWRSDGTDAGTFLLAAINPNGDANPGGYNSGSVLTGTLYFAAQNNTNGRELWSSNGTIAGTVPVADICPGPCNANPDSLTVISGTLYFSADDGVNGRQLWRSDGHNVFLVKNIAAGRSSNPTNFEVNNFTLFFSADDGVNGRELWKSDGSDAGTVLVKDINPGGASSNPDNLTSVQGVLVFTADDGAHGIELWSTDGTTANTVLQDIRPGSAPSEPSTGALSAAPAFAAGPKFYYFTANDGTVGRELWSNAIYQTVTPPIANAGPEHSSPVGSSLQLDGGRSTDPGSYFPLAYLWTQTGGTAVTLSSRSEISPTFTAPALPTVLNFSLVVTDAAGFVSTPATTVITATETAINGLNAQNNGPKNVGALVTLQGTVVLGTNVSFQWNFGDGTVSGVSSSGSFTHTYNIAGTYTAIVTATNSVSTQSSPTSVQINDVGIVSLVTKNDSPTPLGFSTNFTGVASGPPAPTGVTYVWNFGDNVIVGVGSSVTTTHTYASLGNFTALVTATNSVSTVVASTAVTVTDVAITGLTASNSSPTARGDSTALTATISTGTNVTYAWNFGDGQTGSGAITSHVYATANSFVATVTATNGISTVVATTAVTVNPATPIAGLTASNDGPTDEGDATNFTASISAGSGVTYAWAFGDGGTGTGQNPSHAYATPGDYTAVVTATNDAGSVSAQTVVTVNSTQPISGLAAASSSPTRLFSTTAYTATKTGGSGVTYVWNFGDGQTGGGATTTHTYALAGTYPVTVTALNSLGTAEASTVVVVTNQAPVASAGTNQTVTVGQLVSLDGSASADPDSHLPLSFGWTQTGGTLVTLSSKTISQPTFTAPGAPTVLTFQLVVTDTGGLASTPASVTITVNDTTIGGLRAVSNSPQILGTPIAFTGTVTAGSNPVFTWNFEGTIANGANAQFTFPTVGSHTAILTATNSASSQSTSLTVSVTDVPVAGLTAANSGPTTLGGPTSLTATITAGTNVAYSWTFGDGLSGTGITTTHTYTRTGAVTARVTASNGAGSTSMTTTVSVIDVPISGLSAGNTSPTALGGVTSFTSTITGGTNVSYNWTFGDGLTALGPNPTHQYGAEGNYTAIVTATNGVGVVSVATPVTVTQTAITGLGIASSSPTNLNSATSFTATISTGNGVIYTWNFGDGAVVSTGGIAQTQHTYGALGNYTVVVTAANNISTQSAGTSVTVRDVAITGLSATNNSPTLQSRVTTLTATITAGTNANYQWDFGDGQTMSTGTTANAAHTYGSIGTFIATVTATNSIGSAATTTTVTIQDAAIVGLAASNDGPTAEGDPTTLNATVTTGNQLVYAWSFGDGQTGSGASVQHVYGTVSTFTAAVTATNGVNTASATTVVTITSPLSIVGLGVSGTTPTALGAATAFTATKTAGSGIQYTWNFGDNSGEVSTGLTPNTTHAYVALGTFTVTLTGTNSLGSASAETTVVVNDAPITGLSATNSSPTSLGSATSFQATITGGTNVTKAWDFGDGSTGSGETPTHAYAAVGTYTATVTATNSVGSATATTVVNVIDVFITGLTGASSTPTILGNSTAYTASINTGSNVTYAWAFGDGATGSGLNATHTYAAIGSYTAIVTATNGSNSQTAQTVAVVNDVPISGLSAANSGTTAVGSAVAFTATTSGGTGITYQWNFGDGSAVATTGTTPNATHAYATVGNFTTIVTATNTSGSSVATTSVSITDVPITGLAASNNSPTALGGATTLSATIATGTGVTYVWNFGDGTATATGAVVTHSYAAIGSYTAIVTATNSVSSQSATTSVSVIDSQISGLAAASSSPTMLGNATAFTATITGGSNVSYAWNFGDNTATAAGANATHTYAAVGTYTALVTATNTVDGKVASTTVTVTDVPVSGLAAASNSPTTLGGATAFTATISGGTNVSYAWNFGDGTAIAHTANGNSGSNVTHTYAAVGSYTAIVTATNGAGSSTASTVVVVNDVPISGLAAANSSPTTLGGTTALTATITSGSNVSYAWNFGDGTFGSGANTTHTYVAIGSYTAIVTATNGAGSQSVTTAVTISNVPIAFLAASNSGPTALGSATALTATVSSGTNVSYVWNFGDGTATATGANVTHTYAALGMYTATVTATNPIGSASAQTVVVVGDVPVSGLAAANSSPTTISGSTAFTATITGGTNVTYAWNFGDGQTGSGANATHTYAAVGTYTATVTATNSAGSVTAQTVASVHDVPISGLSLYNSSPVIVGTTVMFSATISAGTNVTYTWNFGDGTSVVSTGTTPAVSHVFNTVNTFNVSVTATNAEGSQTVFTVVVVQPYKVYLPGVFR